MVLILRFKILNWLELIAKYNSEWVGMVKSFGETNYYNDIVQDVYMKLHYKYDESRAIINGEPNRALMYTLLRNTFLIYRKHNNDGKQKTKIKKTSIGEGFDILDETNAESEAYERFLNKLDQEVGNWQEFDSKLFKIYIGTYGTQNFKYLGEKQSGRKLHRETGISKTTIFKTLRKCKQRIKENLHEDWQDYRNGDYELI